MTDAVDRGLRLGVPTSIELRRIRVDLVEPIVAAHGTESVREVVVVRAVGPDGTTGWGECDALLRPTYSSEWHTGAWTVLRELVVPSILAGREHGVVGHPMATAAVEAALVDLQLRREGRSLADALGAASDRVVSRAVIGIRSVAEVLAAVERRVAAGHRAVKLKIRPDHALEPLRAVRGAWPDLSLAADANGSFDLDGATALVRGLDGVALDHLEQPLRAGDLVGHATLRRAGGVPICLDESISDVDAVRTAVALGAVDAVNVKPARLGGLAACLAVRDLLLESAVAGFCGGMYELGIGRAVALALAATPGLDGPADLGPSDAYVAVDLTPAVRLAADGTLAVPDGPGIGCEPDPGRLDDTTVERVTLR